MSSQALAYQPPTKVLVYGDDAYPPYSYVEDGVAKGIYSDILRRVFEDLPEYDVTLVPIPWQRGLKMLKVGQGFALYPPYYYSDKRAYIYPYSQPILDEEVVVFCNQESLQGRPKNNWPTDYFGLTVGVNEAFALGGNQFWDAVKAGKINLVEAKGNRPNLLNLHDKKTDCYINDRISILWEISQMANENLLPSDWQPTLGAIVSAEQGYLGFTNQAPQAFPYKKDFVDKFNTALITLQQQGEIQKIINSYFDSTN
ncbi:substrate-binding periplasmic protein [Vibrio ostreicida]|uniref:Transporter substrate-binding domain-containing protein n=1 Tax=Vibrio ostreicida TaxID=526588 RepID=A0ABT8BYN2_9VIBR|nr:transporter substrate-binding domain-containing protein [Vibrio ostreicida]MDN3611799.1 transporter substrate-binding domain-containing protein [Vibrio ostreicida]MDN3612667.1 transporter substrate-binding domain-containing protein [Vibrio ostreicida]MDN3612694.1 transporter substrate-binding domain-containing protein [Vibrio ostreicida]NPD09613.1 transporter substrate-binding domain-containing protein [Vibrio ostreicida]